MSGAGQCFHGPANFNSHVNNRYDTQRGYKGPTPKVGDKPEPSKRLDKVPNFKGNEVRDGAAMQPGENISHYRPTGFLNGFESLKEAFECPLLGTGAGPLEQG